MPQTIVGRVLNAGGVAVLAWGLARLIFGIAIDLPFLPAIPLSALNPWPALGVGLGTFAVSAAIEHRVVLRAARQARIANNDSTKRLE